ncbi:MAG: hypothetical protein JO342_07940 [Solirubrobacterales bacterium]|nr:hypothetical protein [Solirubrobacterales bacterium]
MDNRVADEIVADGGAVSADGWTVRPGSALIRVVWLLAAMLPLVGLVSLLLHSQLDPNYDNHKVHLVLFVGVGAVVSVLAYLAGEAATKRGDARVLLMSLAFLLTGGFPLVARGRDARDLVCGRALWLRHRDICRDGACGGIRVCLGLRGCTPEFRPPGDAATVAAAARCDHGDGVVVRVDGGQAAPAPCAAQRGRHGQPPPLDGDRWSGAPRRRGGALLDCLPPAPQPAASERHRLFVLLSEAMVGVATTGERSWHASWWEWHGWSCSRI